MATLRAAGRRGGTRTRRLTVRRAGVPKSMNLSKATLDLIAKPIEGIELTEMEGEGILYWRERTKMLYLNESARVIWQLCDRGRTVSEIVDALAAEFPGLETEISFQVPELIAQFVAEGVLELVAK